jgi:hypothetical protein
MFFSKKKSKNMAYSDIPNSFGTEGVRQSHITY